MSDELVVKIRLPGPVGKLWESRGRLGRRLARQMVPNLGTLILVSILLWVSGVYAAPGTELAAQQADSSFTTINYQGRLADAGGIPINDTVSLTFALYQSDVDGVAVWSETHGAVPVSDGLFSVRLGSLSPLSTDLLAGDLWLEIQVDTDPPMVPREKLAAVPYAMRALEAQTVPDGAIESRHTRLSTGQVYASIDGGVLELLDDYQDVPGMTVTLMPETAQTYLVYVTAYVYAEDALAIARLAVDGELQEGTIVFHSHADGYTERATVAQTYLVNLTPGTHTLVLKARRYSGTTAKIGEIHTRLTYIAVGQ